MAAVPSDCKQIVHDCTQALDKADKAISDLKAEIDLSDKALAASRVENQDLRLDLMKVSDRDSSILRNPWFDGLIGVVVGVIAYGFIKR